MPKDKHVKIVTYCILSTEIGLLEAHLHFFVLLLTLEEIVRTGILSSCGEIRLALFNQIQRFV